MLDPVQKRKLKGFLYHKTTLLCLLLLVLYALYSTFSVVIKQRESERLLSISAEQLEKLEKRHADIQYKIDNLGTTAGLEAEIRSRFSMAKEGENVAIIVTEKKDEAVPTPPAKTFWERFLSIWK